MARARGRTHRTPPIHPPRTSFHFLAVAVGMFVAFNVGLLVFFRQKDNIYTKNKKKENSMMMSQSQQQKTSTTTTNTEAAGLLFESPEELPDQVIANLDAILVLGGGVPISLEEPPIFVQRRCDDAAKVIQRYHSLSSSTTTTTTAATTSKELAVLCLSAGTAHLPQLLASNGLPIWESTASAAYLIKHYSTTTSPTSSSSNSGNNILKPHQVYAETTSYDTIGNAFYARTSFTDIIGWRNLLIVTNEFHMNRTQAIFDWIYGIEQQQPQQQDDNNKYQLYYLGSPNVGLTDEAVRARKEREAKSLQFVQQQLVPNLQSMRQVWTFLTQEHSLYTASKLVERGRTTTISTTTQQQDDEENSQALKESYGGGKVENEEENNDKELRGRQ